jgi:hypothetical protein
MAGIIVRLELTPGAKKGLEKIYVASGMTQVSMVSRLIQWYADQPPAIKALIMGQIPTTIREDVIRIALRKIGHRPSLI